MVVFFKKGLGFGMFLVDIYGREGRRGMAPTLNFTHIFKRLINFFACIKLIFVCLQFPLFIPWWIYWESNFKNVGAIPCGCNKKWTGREWESITTFKRILFDFSIFLPFLLQIEGGKKEGDGAVKKQYIFSYF